MGQQYGIRERWGEWASSMGSGRGGENGPAVWDQGEVGRMGQQFGIRERWGEWASSMGSGRGGENGPAVWHQGESCPQMQIHKAKLFTIVCVETEPVQGINEITPKGHGATHSILYLPLFEASIHQRHVHVLQDNVQLCNILLIVI